MPSGSSTRQLLVLLACVSTLFAGALIGSVLAIELLALESVEVHLPSDEERTIEPGLPQGDYEFELVLPSDDPSGLPESLHVGVRTGEGISGAQTLYSREVSLADCLLGPSDPPACDLALVEMSYEAGRVLVLEPTGQDLRASLLIHPPQAHYQGRLLGLLVISLLCIPAAVVMVFVLKRSAENAATTI